MSDVQMIRDALTIWTDSFVNPPTEYHAALDRLVAERDAAREDVVLRGEAARIEAQEALARAEAAEKERDEALDSVVLYVNERDRALARADNLAPYVARCATLEAALEHHTGLVARCATLEAALDALYEAHGHKRWDGTRDPTEGNHTCGECADALDALAAASQPADSNAAVTKRESSQPAEKDGTAFERSLLRADIKAGNAEAAEAQLQRIKRLEADSQPAEEESWGSMDRLTGGTATPAEEDC